MTLADGEVTSLPVKAGGRPSLEVGLLVAAIAAVVAFYVLPYAFHLQLPPGDDSPFYVGAIRDVAKLGLIDPQIGARPAYPLLGAMLESSSGVSPWTVTAGLPIALVITLGLSGGALASRWGLRGFSPVGFVLLAALSGIAARLVAGKAENLMVLALLCALVAIHVWARGVRRWIGIGAVALSGWLTEWPLMVGFICILAVYAVVCLFRRDSGSLRSIAPLTLGTAAGFAVALPAILLGSHAAIAIEHLPGAQRYGARLHSELRLLWAPLVVVLAALGWWAGRRLRDPKIEPVRHLLTVWLLLTGVVTLGGVLGAAFPAYRVITFALPALLASAGAAFVVGGWRGRRFPRVVTVARPLLGLLIGLASLLPAFDMWYFGLPPPISAAGIAEMEGAARYAASLPGGGPAVLVVRLNASHFLEFQRLAHDVQPDGSRAQVLVFVGAIVDALAGRPSKAFSPAGETIVRALFPPIGRALREGAPILTGRALNPRSFAHSIQRGDPTFAGGTLSVVRGPRPAGKLLDAVQPMKIDPIAAATVAVVAVVAMFLSGIGWCLLMIPRAPQIVLAGLAPALGTVALSVIGFAGSRAGAHPGYSAAAVEVGTAVGLSLLAGAFALLRRSRGPTEGASGTDHGRRDRLPAAT